MYDSKKVVSIALGLLVIAVLLVSTATHASTKTVDLFGVELASATRDAFRKALRQHGLEPTRLDNEGWFDEYNPAGAIPGVNKVIVRHERATGLVAEVRYDLGNGRNTFIETAERLASSYGNPSYLNGNLRIGSAQLYWGTLRDVQLMLGRGWPSSQTNLHYRVKGVYERAKRELEAAETAQVAREREATAHAF